MHRKRMRTYQHTAFAVLDRYDIFYGGHKSDAGVYSASSKIISLKFILILSSCLYRDLPSGLFPSDFPI